MSHSLESSPSTSSRVLGLVGVLGGAVLLLGVVPFDWNTGFFQFRLVLFIAGAMAIVFAVHRRQAPVAPALALVAAVPALLANAWYLAMVVFSIVAIRPFARDEGLVFFTAGVALWITDAVFGLVTLRLAKVDRWGALAVALGSLLVFTGMDRLGLTSSANPTTFGPLALTGGVLTAIGWILMGIDIARGGRGVSAPSRKLVDA